MLDRQVEKPQRRGTFRKIVGREYFVLRRRLRWMRERNWARVERDVTLPVSVMRHRSMLLRPLRNVDMYLQHNKITNLRIAASHIDGVVIRPGEVMSVWRMVGRPTRRKGYLEGMMLHNGQITSGVGGGLCQLGNLLYWMALHTPLTVRERWRHGFDVFPDVNRTIPFACGATLSYNYIDLQLQNNTQQTFQILLWLDEEYLNGEILCDSELAASYRIVETDHCFEHQWWGGYTRHNRIWKEITRPDGSVERELVAENHAIMMYNPMLES